MLFDPGKAALRNTDIRVTVVGLSASLNWVIIAFIENADHLPSSDENNGEAA